MLFTNSTFGKSAVQNAKAFAPIQGIKAMESLCKTKVLMKNKPYNSRNSSDIRIIMERLIGVYFYCSLKMRNQRYKGQPYFAALTCTRRKSGSMATANIQSDSASLILPSAIRVAARLL